MLSFVPKSSSLKKSVHHNKNILPPSNPESNSCLWYTKNKPKTVKELVVHSSKINATREWLVSAVAAHANPSTTTGDYCPRVLALCGCSGSCKTTLLQVLCKELGIEIIEWTDDMWESDSNARYNPFRDKGLLNGSVNCINSGGSNGIWDPQTQSRSGLQSGTQAYMGLFDIKNEGMMSSDGRLMTSHGRQTKSQLSELEDFTMRSLYPALLTTTSTTNTTATTSSSSSNKKRHRNDDAKPSSSSSTSATTPLLSSSSSSSQSSFPSRILSSQSSFPSRILLMRDPPTMRPQHINSDTNTNGGHDNSTAGSDLMETLCMSQLPIVMIISDVSGRDDLAYSLQEIIPNRVQSMINLQSIYCPPITVAKIQKTLMAIAKSVIQELAEESLGDLRHAITSLQWCAMGKFIKKEKEKTVNSMTVNTTLSMSLSLTNSKATRGRLQDSGNVTTSTTFITDNGSCGSKGQFDDPFDLTGGDNDNDNDNNNNNEVFIEKAVTKTMNGNGNGRGKGKGSGGDGKVGGGPVSLSSSTSSSSSSSSVREKEKKKEKEKQRDVMFSSLHSVAKLLAAKLDDDGGKLAFSPEVVIE
eukprot:gene6481-13084_t